MAKQQFTPVFAEGFMPPPDDGGGYSSNYGGPSAKFQPWRFFEFTGNTGKHPEIPEGCETPEMSDEQLEAYHYIKEFMRGQHRRDAELSDDNVQLLQPDRFRGRVLILTGAAGSGKSTLVKWLTSTLGASICATTGSAALLVGGTTIDLMFAFRRSTWKINANYLQDSMFSTTDNIIVDEASMMGDKMASVVAEVMDLYPRKRLILVGDWAQAAPVKEDWPFMTPLFLGAEVVKLNKCYRQAEGEYLDALNTLRNGTLSEYFEQCVSIPPGSDDDTLCMYATNAEAASRNKIMFDRWVQMSGERPVKMRAHILTNRGGDWREGGVPDWKEEGLYRDSKMAHGMEFCIGARILITRNEPGAVKTYVNGDVGTIMNMPEFFPQHFTRNAESWPPIEVKLDRTGETVPIRVAEAEMFDPFVNKSVNPNVKIVGYPMVLGWAVTIHKSQGMTLPAAFVSLSSLRRMPSKHGLAYVALSRTRDISTLRIDQADYGVAERDIAVEGLI